MIAWLLVWGCGGGGGGTSSPMGSIGVTEDTGTETTPPTGSTIPTGGTGLLPTGATGLPDPTGDTGALGTSPGHASCGPVVHGAAVVRTEWLPLAPVGGIGGPDLVVEPGGRLHVVRTDNVGGFHGHHFVDDGGGWMSATLAPSAAALAVGWTASGLEALAYGGSPGSTVHLGWDAATGWSPPTSPALDLFVDPVAVGVADGELVLLQPAGTLGRLGPPVTTESVLSDIDRPSVAVRADDTVDSYGWAVEGRSFRLVHGADGLVEVVWDSGVNTLETGRIVAIEGDDGLYVFFDHGPDLYGAVRRGGVWTIERLTSLPNLDCGPPPYDPTETCAVDQAAATPLVAVWTDEGPLLVHGLRHRQAVLTAVQAGFGGYLYYEWSPWPAWAGDVRAAVWTPGSGLGPADIWLDGVVATHGQGQLVGDRLHLALHDVECQGLFLAAARYVEVAL